MTPEVTWPRDRASISVQQLRICIYVDFIPVDSIHEKPAKLKKWTIFFGGHPKQQNWTPLAKKFLAIELKAFQIGPLSLPSNIYYFAKNCIGVDESGLEHTKENDLEAIRGRWTEEPAGLKSESME
jgi:hypothetical protein